MSHRFPGCVFSLCALLSCGGSSTPNIIGPVASVTITPALDTIYLSATDVFTAVGRDADGHVVTATTTTWQVITGAVASVTQTGQVHGLSAGTTTVTATLDGVTGQATLVVVAAPVASVTVTPQSDSVPIGSVIQYQALARDSNNAVILGLYPTWSSTASGVATVSPGGMVTGVSQGTATIEATVGSTVGGGAVKVRTAFLRGDTVATPVMDLAGTYLSFAGRLYPGGNQIPVAHLAAGTALGRSVVPLDINGNPSAMGKYVLMSIGMSNTTQEWCHSQWDAACNAWSFTGQAQADQQVRRSGLVIVNGAKGSQTAPSWVPAGAANYIRIRDSVLVPQGLSEQQVQVIWLKLANAMPGVSLPHNGADALHLYSQLGSILRALKVQYPKLKLVLMTSRVYAGYNAIQLNPEPYAYEYGFSMKWLIGEQIRQVDNPSSAADPATGDLDYTTGVAPWAGWGPYLWARGTQPRADGLTWPQTYLESDGVHPSDLGEEVVGAELLTFFKTSPVTRCWFATSGTCP